MINFFCLHFLEIIFILLFLFFFLFISVFILLVIFIIIIIIIVLIFQINNCILLILIFSNQITNILISLLKFHLIHSFALIPMQECLSLIHFSKLCTNSLKDTLYCSRIGNKGSTHWTTFLGNTNQRRLHIIWNPRYKI